MSDLAGQVISQETIFVAHRPLLCEELPYVSPLPQLHLDLTLCR